MARADFLTGLTLFALGVYMIFEPLLLHQWLSPAYPKALQTEF